LSPYDDGGIPCASYPNMPVSISREEKSDGFTDRTSALCLECNNKFREAREGKLVVYELLVRDFDAGRNYLN
jgi:hypothetical protein